MKKTFAFFVCLTLVWLCKMSSARAQTIEVGLYNCRGDQTVPADYPADDAPGWKNFQFNLTESRSLDTLTWAYLHTDAKPEYNSSSAITVTLNAIGFNFPYGGRTMTHFGLTGNGSVFLSDGSDNAQRSITPNNAYTMYPSGNNHVDEIMVAPRLTSSKSNPYVVADAQSRIRYYVKENEYLIVNFTDVVARYYTRKFSNGWVFPEYAYRWSSDVILYADGRIQGRVTKAELVEHPEDDASPKQMLYFAFGLFGQAKETAVGAVFTAAPKDNAGHSAITVGQQKLVQGVAMNAMEVKTDSTDLCGQVFTFVAPQACVAPEGVSAQAEYSSLYTDEMSVSLKRTGVCDGWIVFLADKETAVKPQNGKLYSIGNANTPADEIDGNPLRIAGNGLSFKAEGLTEGQQYYIYVYPYNNECAGGPVYGEAIKIKAPIAEAAPKVVAEETTATSARFTFPDLKAGEELLVGVSRYAYRSKAKPHYELDSVLSGKVYVKDDELFRDKTAVSTYGTPIVIKTAHVGAVKNNSLTIDGLKPGTPYYFYFWKITGEGQYAVEYAEAGVRTVGNMPYTLTFVNDRVPQSREMFLPAGWSGTASSNYLDSYIVKNSASAALPAERSALAFNGTALEVETPAFTVSQAATDLTYRIFYSGGKWSSGSQFDEGDTLKVSYAEVGKEAWTTVDVLVQSKEDTLVYGSDGFANRKIRLDNMPAGKNIRLKFSLKKSKSYFYLHDILIEPRLSCAYAENIVVEGDLRTSRTLTVSFNHSNVTATGLLTYRQPGEDNWSQPRVVYGGQGTVRGLKANTAYEIGLRLVCGERDSSLVKTVKGTTLLGLPYAEVFRDIPIREDAAAPLPTGVYSGIGILPGGDTVAKISGPDAMATTTFKVGGHAERKGHTIVAVSFHGATSGHAWLGLPVLSLDEKPYPARCIFRYKSGTFVSVDAEGQPINVPVTEKVPETNQFRVYVLVSSDGEFRRSDIVDSLTWKDFNTLDIKTLEVDLSSYTNRVYIALYADDPTGESALTGTASLFRNTFFAIDSVSVYYTDNQPCDPVEFVRVSNITQTEATMSWTGYSEEYAIEFTNDDTGETEVIYTKEMSHTFTGLTPSTLYLYRIQGYCESGHRSPSGWTEENGFMTRMECATPTNFAIVGISDRSVQISASASGTRLIHLWSEDGVYDKQMLWQEALDTTNVSGLSPETVYSVRVRNICMTTDSSAWTPALKFTTKVSEADKPVCGTPTALACDSIGQTYAVLNWTAGENNISYIISYRLASSAAAFTKEAVSETVCRLEGLQANTAYSWRMNGVCAADTSALVDGSDFTTAKKETGVEKSLRFSGLKVGSDHGRIAVYNADALPIDRVQVYGLNGHRLYDADFGGMTDNLLLPVLDGGARMVLVRVFSAGESFVYKIVLM